MTRSLDARLCQIDENLAERFDHAYATIDVDRTSWGEPGTCEPARVGRRA